jgi:hypothetical protein
MGDALFIYNYERTRMFHRIARACDARASACFGQSWSVAGHVHTNDDSKKAAEFWHCIILSAKRISTYRASIVRQNSPAKGRLADEEMESFAQKVEKL